jgi:hypothetical protein
MIRRTTLFRLSLLLVLLASGPAAATLAPSTYTDQTAWETAVGGDTSVLADFNGSGSDISFASSTIDVGSFSMAQRDINGSLGGLDPGDFNLVDIPAFFGPPDLSLDGTSYVRGFVNYDADDIPNETQNTRAIWMGDFDNPIYAWGADFSQANGLAGLSFRLITEGGESVDIDGPLSNDTGFWGFVGSSSDPYTEILVFAKASYPGSIFGEEFGMDNVVGAAVPEPTPAAMISLGLVLMAVHGRRSRR